MSARSKARAEWNQMKNKKSQYICVSTLESYHTSNTLRCPCRCSLVCHCLRRRSHSSFLIFFSFFFFNSAYLFCFENNETIITTILSHWSFLEWHFVRCRLFSSKAKKIEYFRFHYFIPSKLCWLCICSSNRRMKIIKPRKLVESSRVNFTRHEYYILTECSGWLKWINNNFPLSSLVALSLSRRQWRRRRNLLFPAQRKSFGNSYRFSRKLRRFPSKFQIDFGSLNWNRNASSNESAKAILFSFFIFQCGRASGKRDGLRCWRSLMEMSIRRSRIWMMNGWRILRPFGPLSNT